MEEIFHEKQEGSLCAQHCLNALLQGSYFTAVDLATHAKEIDEAERSRMAEGGIHSADYSRFIEQPSGNMDDSGYFSVQVIQSALKIFGLELMPYQSQNVIAVESRRSPISQAAYICNFHDHWLTIRKLGNQWFNLNSLLTGPELISDTFLALFLAQLQNEGYSIFIVIGQFPDCSADKMLRLQPAVQHVKPKLISETKKSCNIITEEDFANALRETMAESLDDEKESLETALALSLSEYQAPPSGSSREENISSPREQQLSPDQEMSEQEMMEAAIRMSMET